MIKKLLLIGTLGVSLSGCFMAPIALIGPVTSGFSTASLIQAGVSSGANYVVKKNTGKTISEHAFGSVNNKEILQQSYLPNDEIEATIKINKTSNFYMEDLKISSQKDVKLKLQTEISLSQ